MEKVGQTCAHRPHPAHDSWFILTSKGLILFVKDWKAPKGQKRPH
jgi:hypothetical protein